MLKADVDMTHQAKRRSFSEIGSVVMEKGSVFTFVVILLGMESSRLTTWQIACSMYL